MVFPENYSRKKKSNKSFTKVIWSTILLSFLCPFVVIYQYTLLKSVVNSKESQVVFSDHLIISDSFYNSKEIAIILQQSPVDVANQINRLKNIDDAYAKWTGNHTDDVSIYAVVADDNKKLDFKYLRVLHVNLNKSDSGILRMVSAIYKLLEIAPHKKWFMICNDHTFIAIPNLIYFLKSFNHDDLIYSGNKLAINYKSSILSFASGGAGIILSHSSIKLIMLTWAIIKLPSLAELMSDFGSDQQVYKKKYENLSRNKNPVIFDTWNTSSSRYDSISNVIIFLSKLSEYKDFFDKEISIHLSSTICLLIKVSSVLEDYLITLLNHQKGTQYTVKYSDIKKCTAESEWEKTNPGIILAYCLMNVFKLDFSDSKTIDNYERFNVYGTIRMLTKDLDTWYTDAKKLQARNKNNENFELTTEPVSFHYISSFESKFLYFAFNLYGDKNCDSSRVGSLFNASGLLNVWPRKNADIGHYSIGLKNLNQAQLLSDYLNRLCLRKF